jgi:hypothetical protein
MDSCLNDPNNYWDQETFKCISGYSEDIIKKTCLDPDEGKNLLVQAHTYGFRSSYANDEDKRIRTGGKDACTSETKLVEHICNDNGFIQTLHIDCPNGCINGTCSNNTKGFRYAYWECHNDEEQRFEDDTSCKPPEIWHKYAKDFCDSRCIDSPDGKKCGIKKYSINVGCYYRENVIVEDEVEDETEEDESEEIKEQDEIEGIPVCTNSCPLDDKCYPFGYRRSGDYCSDKGAFITQIESEANCENNFECQSNVCISGQCVSQNLMEKILNWFKRLFGAS